MRFLQETLQKSITLGHGNFESPERTLNWSPGHVEFGVASVETVPEATIEEKSLESTE